MKDKEPDRDMEKIRREFQIGKEGLSYDYHNQYGTALGLCRKLLNGEVSQLGWTEEKTRINILEKMKSMLSYTEYMASQKKIRNVDISLFLTARGLENVAELDNNTAEIKRLVLKGPQEFDAAAVLRLIEECEILIERRYKVD